jgi:hypothetical protein
VQQIQYNNSKIESKTSYKRSCGDSIPIPIKKELPQTPPLKELLALTAVSMASISAAKSLAKVKSMQPLEKAKKGT